MQNKRHRALSAISEALGRLNSPLRKALAGFCALIMSALCLVVLWGIFTRYLIGEQAQFTDEAARMLLIMATFFGAAYAFAVRAHIGLEVLYYRLSPDAKRLCLAISYALVALFLGGVLIYGGSLLISTSMRSGNTLSSMPVKMWHVYLSVPISGILALSFTLENLLKSLLEEKKEEA